MVEFKSSLDFCMNACYLNDYLSVSKCRFRYKKTYWNSSFCNFTRTYAVAYSVAALAAHPEWQTRIWVGVQSSIITSSKVNLDQVNNKMHKRMTQKCFSQCNCLQAVNEKPKGELWHMRIFFGIKKKIIPRMMDLNLLEFRMDMYMLYTLWTDVKVEYKYNKRKKKTLYDELKCVVCIVWLTAHI